MSADEHSTYEQTKANKKATRTIAQDVPAQAEALNYTDQLTNTGTVMGDTSDGYPNSLGLPFDTLTFTKSAGVNANTIDIHFTVTTQIIVIGTLTGGETIAITATSDGAALGNILLVDSTGSIVSATGLTAGTYYIYQG